MKAVLSFFMIFFFLVTITLYANSMDRSRVLGLFFISAINDFVFSNCKPNNIAIENKIQKILK